jgi:hypothetical protein
MKPMKLAVVLPADQPPADHLAAYYKAQSDGRWVLQIDQPPPATDREMVRQDTADKAKPTDAASNSDGQSIEASTIDPASPPRP